MHGTFPALRCLWKVSVGWTEDGPGETTPRFREKAYQATKAEKFLRSGLNVTRRDLRLWKSGGPRKANTPSPSG
jgi:hypothetical protein